MAIIEGTNNYGIPYIEFKNRKAWLKGRIKGLGASEISAAVNSADAFMTRSQLWEKKINKNIKEIVDNPRINYGQNAEEYLRKLFELQNIDKYSVEYHAFRIYHSTENSFMTCTLDGELVDKNTNDYGVWECKTSWINSAIDRKAWDNQIPNKYFCQILSQMYIMQADFCILTAQLIYPDGDSEIRHYRFERKNVEEDIKYIVEKSKEFWNFVETKTEPPLIINL